MFLQRFQEWLGSNSELTPSETVETIEDDESEVRDELCTWRGRYFVSVSCTSIMSKDH